MPETNIFIPYSFAGYNKMTGGIKGIPNVAYTIHTDGIVEKSDLVFEDGKLFISGSEALPREEAKLFLQGLELGGKERQSARDLLLSARHATEQTIH